MPSNQISWPSDADLWAAEYSELVLLCRVLDGLRRLSGSDEPPALSGVVMPIATQKLVDILAVIDARIVILVTQLKDGMATGNEQRDLADQFEELIDLLRSHADDVDAGIVTATCHPFRTQ